MLGSTELRETIIVNRNYGEDKAYIFNHFYQQYLVLLTMSPVTVADLGIAEFHGTYRVYWEVADSLPDYALPTSTNL